MKKYFERASSTERWFMILSALLVFVVLNLFFVRPLFGDWAKYQTRRDKAQTTVGKFEDAIAQAEKLKPIVDKMQGEGMSVLPEEQVLNFMSAIQQQAVASGVTIVNSSPQPQRTNQFFVERAQAVNTLSGEEELVDFLYHLGAGDSLTRVRGLTLRPDAPRQKLSGNITLVASFQKKAVARAAAAAAPAKTNAPTVKPTTAPTTTPTNKIAQPQTNKVTQPAADKTKPSGAPGVPKPVTTPNTNPK